MKPKQKLVYIFILFCFFSCTNDLDYEGEMKPLMVLNGVLQPDSTVKINLYKSKSFMAGFPNFNVVDDAKVLFWKNGQKVGELKNNGKGNYSSEEKVQVGDEITLTATSNYFPDGVQASTLVVPKVNVLAIDTLEVSFEKLYRNKSEAEEQEYPKKDDGKIHYEDKDTVGFVIENLETELRIKIKDKKTEKNFYALNTSLRVTLKDDSVVNIPLYLFSDDPVFKSFDVESSFDEVLDAGDFSSGKKYYIRNNFFSDSLFDGEEYTIMLRIRNRYKHSNHYYSSYDDIYFPYYSKDKSAEKDCKTPIKFEFIVNIESISQSMYWYRRSRFLYAEKGDGEGLSEPVQIYSNVDGGVGILGSVSRSIFSFEVKRIVE